MTPKTCHAARTLLGWTQVHLARQAQVGLSTVVDFEKQRREVGDEVVQKMKRTLEAGGVEFTGTKHRPGLRTQSAPPRPLSFP